MSERSDIRLPPVDGVKSTANGAFRSPRENRSKALTAHARISLYRTLAIAAPGKREKRTGVTIPPEGAVIRAKEWIEENET